MNALGNMTELLPERHMLFLSEFSHPVEPSFSFHKSLKQVIPVEKLMRKIEQECFRHERGKRGKKRLEVMLVAHQPFASSCEWPRRRWRYTEDDLLTLCESDEIGVVVFTAVKFLHFFWGFSLSKGAFTHGEDLFTRKWLLVSIGRTLNDGVFHPHSVPSLFLQFYHGSFSASMY